MLLIANLITSLGLLMPAFGIGLHHVESREGRERAVDGITHLARSSNGNFNGHLNESIDINVFERIRESKNQTGAFNESDISKMRVYNVGVLMASHLGKWTGRAGGSSIKSNSCNLP